MTCVQGNSLGPHLGQTNILLLSVHHCNTEEGQGGAGWEDSGYVWEEFRVVSTEREYFVPMQTNFFFFWGGGVPVSAHLLDFLHTGCLEPKLVAGPTYASRWERTGGRWGW